MSTTRLFLLVRECSSYTEANIVLGCFRSMESALLAKTEYIVSIGKTSDLHEIQGYMRVCLEDDLHVDHVDVEIEVKRSDARSVFLLFEESDGFGQIDRELKYGTFELSDLIKFAKSNPIVDDGFSACFVYDEIVLDCLRYENSAVYLQ